MIYFFATRMALKGKTMGMASDKFRYLSAFSGESALFLLPPAGSRQYRRQTVTGAYLF